MNRFQLGLELVEWGSVRAWLDIGCGMGDFLALVDQQYAIERLIGVDVSSTMIQEARLKTYRAEHSAFHQLNFMSLRETETFDLISSIGVLQKCGVAPMVFFAKVYSLLKDGGRAFIDTKKSSLD